MANTKQTAKTVNELSFKELLEKARKLEEGEKLPTVDRKYTAVTNTDTMTVSVTLEIPLSEVVKSAKGKNYVVPVGNVHGFRGSNVIEAHTPDGLIVRLYSDRAYISSEAENEKAVKAKTSSEKDLLKEQNAMLLALLKKNGIEL